MSAINDGGPAFPVLDNHGDGALYCRCGGMSLRDWFAGQALPAVIAATSAGQHHVRQREGEDRIAYAIARDAYEMADAMLAARSEQP